MKHTVLLPSAQEVSPVPTAQLSRWKQQQSTRSPTTPLLHTAQMALGAAHSTQLTSPSRSPLLKRLK